mmetsp:Transcript_16508/g.15834  ORF Transcript_16508/g.15834 Transcript_16508/m.15834 type:complete len:112 (+) Transcript_16508:122-457(+)
MATRTKIWTGFVNRFWKKQTYLEYARFTMYICVPIFSSAIYANPERMHRIITYWNLVEYPAGKEIPLGEDILKFRVTNTEIESYKLRKAEKEKLEMEKLEKLEKLEKKAKV